MIDEPQLIREELNFNVPDLRQTADAASATLTDEQRRIFDAILEAVQNNESKQFFVKARGGTGKTFLFNTILDKIRSSIPGGGIALAMATTGIAANLLHLGRTFHSRYYFIFS